MKSVYLHIPFCNSICPYCDFSRILYNKDKANQYLMFLEKEIKKTYHNEKIATIYIGGGTPTVLNLEQLKKLFAIIAVFKQENNCEITIESNCEIETTKLIFLKTKVTRISFGVQSFNDNILKYLGRQHTGAMAYEKIMFAKKQGFKNISVDLIYGLSNQTLDDLKSDIEIIKELDVQHVSCYSLMLKENTVFFNKPSIAEETELEMYYFMIARLKDFINYELSNFAKENYFSNHNLNYWNNNEYYGFGMGAVGYINGIRYYNSNDWAGYINGLRNEEVVSLNEKIQNEFILGLRKKVGIREKDFVEKYGKSFLDYDIIRKLIFEKNLIFENGFLFIPRNKFYVMNNILVELMTNYQ